MKFSAAAFAVLACIAGCANGPATLTGANEWVIAESGRDAWHSNAAVRTVHERQAATICGGDGGHAVRFEAAPPDTRYHFRCVSPVHSRAEEMDSARGAWLTCLESAEPAVDDLLSDGHTVASVLATRCMSEFEYLTALAGKGYRWIPSDEAMQRFRRDVALDVVLRVRAQKRNPSVTPPPVVVPSLGPGNQ